jgi:hypothetical protein
VLLRRRQAKKLFEIGISHRCPKTVITRFREVQVKDKPD